MCVVAHVNADLAAPSTRRGWCDAQNYISFWEAGGGRAEGLGLEAGGACSITNPQILHCRALREITDADEGSGHSVTSLESLSIFSPPPC